VYREKGSGQPLDAVVCNQEKVPDLHRFSVVNVTGNEGYDLLAMQVVQKHRKYVYTREF
jgi:hypothetical protein